MIKRSFLSLIKILIVCAVLLPACKNKTKTTLVTKDSLVKVTAQEMGIPGNFSAQTNLKFDSTIIKTFLDNFPKFKPFEKDITTFYKERKYAYAWYDDKGLIEPASNLYNRIMNISDEGVTDSVPYKNIFKALMDTVTDADKIAPNIELMLTAQYLAYAKKVWQGLSEKQSLAAEWFLPRKKLTSQQLLDSLVSGKNFLENSPVYKQYNLLKNYLKKYNELKAQGNFEAIKADKKTYKLKDSSATILAIRERLLLLGDLAVSNNTSFFDSTLLKAVKNFERRLGYTEDGIINTALIAEMNYPIEKRIEQIMVNMERSRWIPVKLDSDYLLVNIPEYKLHVFEHGSLVFSMNVVVGKDQHKTVIFNGEMKYIVFSPYWNIPASIIKNEIIPGIKKNPNYLVQHNMEWNGGRIRQKPGPNNSLGKVKFLFPNSHNIYLHDSPAKSLFKEDNRAFSHGCIRLADAKKLAEYLLRNDTSWNDAKITAAMNKGTEEYVTLKKTIPVLISYFTAWVDSQGKLNFRKDIYKNDSRLAQMMIEKPSI